MNSSTEAEMELIQPLSLQDICFVQLICKLETFPPESLAFLPVNMRYKLLKNLPAVNVHQFENTALARGLDMLNSEVWQCLCHNRLPSQLVEVVLADLDDVHNGEGGTDWREVYFHCLTFSVLNTYMPHPYGLLPRQVRMEFILDAIFSIPDCLGISNWKAFKHPFTLFTGGMFHPLRVAPLLTVWCTPPRHAWIRDPKYECTCDLQLLHVLMTECEYFPKQLTVVTHDGFTVNHLWSGRQCVNLLLEFLSQVEAVKFIPEVDWNHWHDSTAVTGESTVASFVLETLLSAESPSLKSIKIEGEVARCLSHMVILMSQDSNLHNHSLQAIYQQSLRNIPYGALQSLHIHVGDHWDPLDAVEAGWHFHSIVANQSSLKQLYISHWPFLEDGANSVQLIKTLCVQFCHPHFECLTLEHMRLHSLILKVLIESFLVIPHTSEKQSLQLRHIDVVRCESDAYRVSPELAGINGYRCKVLTLSEITCNTIAPLLKWIGTYPNLKLHMLTIESLVTLNVDGDNILGCFSSNPRAQIEEMRIVNSPLSVFPSSSYDFKGVLCHLQLTCLVLDSCNLGPSGLLPSLGEGLEKQISLQTLETLSLQRNMLSLCPEWELQEFLDVLFSLPELKQLHVLLQQNGFEVHHLQLLIESWRGRAQGKQLKILELSDYKLPELQTVSELRKVSNFLSYRCAHLNN